MATIRRAMLLAAGKGERLKPLTDHRPKPLVPVGGVPMVAYVLKLLAAHGVREVHMNTFYLGNQIPQELGDGSRFGVTLCYHPEQVLLGTGGGLANAANACPALREEPLLMINSDILTDVDLSRLATDHAASGAIATLTLRADAAAEAFGAIGIDSAGQIRRFLAHGKPEGLRNLMFTGVQMISPGLFAYMPATAAFPITDTYIRAFLAGEKLRGTVHAGYWNDLGTPERLLAASADVETGRFTPAPDVR